MSENEQKPRGNKGGLNVNTILTTIVLGTMAWVGNTLKDNVNELAKLREKIAVIEAVNVQKVDQLNRIESRQAAQQDQINAIQLELARLRKVSP
jgi:cell division protein FtsB